MSTRIVAIIQARMGSTRLPGKVLKPIAGKPLLWHIVHRLRRSRLIQEIAIATTTDPKDQAIVEFARGEAIAVIRGPEHDVLARFVKAAEDLAADVIVRVSSDAPFLDAGFIDHLVESLIAQKCDYVLMEDGALCAHEGVDPLTRRALLKLAAEAGSDPVAREHVTGYFKLHPDFVPIARAKAYPSLARDAGRLTIDTRDDLAFVEAVHQRLEARAGEASLADLLALLEREPALRRLNAHVRQKQLSPQSGRTLIRCDGGGKFGYGHIKRMTSLARALREGEGMGVQFALHGSEEAREAIQGAGFEAVMIHDHRDLAALVAKEKFDILILDGREGPSRPQLEAMRSALPLVAIIDDPSEARLACDLAYYPPVPQALALDWSGRTKVRIGWEWALLGLDLHVMPAHAPANRPTLLVAMGGSDPNGLTLRAAQALRPLDTAWRIRFVIGKGMKDGARIAASIVAMKENFETVEGLDDLSIEYAGADLALCAFGVTAYELGAFGVPALYLGLTPDHARSAEAFADAGMGISLGVASRATDSDILSATARLMHDGEARARMRRMGLSALDGRGALRIAADLAAALRQAEAALKVRR